MDLNFNDLIDMLDGEEFDERPVDLRTFVQSPDYLGLPPLSEYQYTLIEKSSQIYKESTLIKLFGEEEGVRMFKQTANEVVAQLGKGSGKDYCSTISVAYIVYLLLCLKDPASYYGKPPGDSIDIINIAINAQQANNVFFKGFRTRIDKSPWFVGKYTEKASEIKFNKNITVHSGHSEREAWEGYNVIVVILDEISGFSVENTTGHEQAKTGSLIYEMYRASVDSRFPDYGKVILLSFPRYKNDYIQQRYDDVVAEKEVITRTHHFKLDDNLPDGTEGNEFDIEWEEDHILSYKYPRMYALRRPTWEINPVRTIDDFKTAFYTNPTDALSRFACMPPEAVDAFFKSREKIERALSLRNPLDQNRRFDLNFKPNPDTIYYVHADLAQKHDKCAVAISHVEKWVEVQSFNDYTQVVPFVVVDAIAWWEPKREGPVDLSEVKNWIINLKRNGFNLGMVTFDRWQSFDIQQELKQVSITTETLSVAKKHYEDLAMLFYEERVAAPHIDILLDELLELRIMPNNRVDHPRKKSKDLADAMCGSVYNAISKTRREAIGDVEIHTWSSFKADRNRDLVEEKAKPKMTEDIEEYLRGFKLL